MLLWLVLESAPSTQSFDLTATEMSDHELRFTFFDGSGDGTTTTGSFDEVYVYQKEGNLLNGKPLLKTKWGDFKLRNRVNHTTDSNVRMSASESKLNLYANDGGADAQHSIELESGVNYQISASIGTGNFNSIDFQIYDA